MRPLGQPRSRPIYAWPGPAAVISPCLEPYFRAQFLLMKEIAKGLSLKANEAVAIIGCGGKSTLLWGLARHYDYMRVLVTTSTKIGRPQAQLYDSISDIAELGRLMPPAKIAPGVHLAASLYGDSTHVSSLPLEAIEAMRPGFDLVLIEADGSRTLPVKGWAGHEPVVPAFTTTTIGLATIHAEGLPIDKNTVHRPEIFCLLSGAGQGEKLSLAHLAAATAHSNGLMAKARGRKILLINQIESAAALAKAREFKALLPQNFLDSLDRVLAVSLHAGTATTI